MSSHSQSAQSAAAESRETASRSTSRWRRAASTVVGGALLAVGLRRRSLAGMAGAVAGGWLVYRSVNRGPGRDQSEEPASVMDVERSVTIGRSAEELHELWREPETLTQTMGHFAEVVPTTEDRHRWTVHGPMDRDVSWETEVVENQPGEYMRWESTEGARLPTEGSIALRPAPDDRGTEMTLHVSFDPPGGTLGASVLQRLDIVPETVVSKALHRFKSLAETGEIPTLERNPSARGSGDLV